MGVVVWKWGPLSLHFHGVLLWFECFFEVYIGFGIGLGYLHIKVCYRIWLALLEGADHSTTGTELWQAFICFLFVFPKDRFQSSGISNIPNTTTLFSFL